MGEETIQEISLPDAQALKRFVSIERRLMGGDPLFVSNFHLDLIRNLSGKSVYTHRVDVSLVIESVSNIGRMLALDEDYQGFGLSGELAAIVLEAGISFKY